MKKVVKIMVQGVLIVITVCELSYIAGFQMARGRMDAERGYKLFEGDPRSSAFKHLARVQLGM